MREASQKASGRKESAISFLKLAASGRVEEAYGNHIPPTFRHHNAYFAGDAESLKKGMADAHKQFPNTTIEVKHALEDGDLVAIHSRVSHGPDQADISVVHLFRFEGNRIAELWDVGMEAPKESPNENGLF
jgi:predicted SnoaL-like aldol condensation-catalyzing enzyme